MNPWMAIGGRAHLRKDKLNNINRAGRVRLIGGKRGELLRERGKTTKTAMVTGQTAGKTERKGTQCRDGFMRISDKYLDKVMGIFIF
jgi:hypothetical protein